MGSTFLGILDLSFIIIQDRLKLIKLSKRRQMSKTIILDTNVYGELLLEKESKEIIKKIIQDKQIHICGIEIIEKELKETPREINYQDQVLKEAVLSIYESLIQENLKLSPLAEHLAKGYYKEFDRLRNSGRHKLLSKKIKKYTEENLKIDFQIIAIASIKNIDIVVSTDKRTMLSEIAEETYCKVNEINGLQTPKLVKYSEFIGRYRNG